MAQHATGNLKGLAPSEKKRVERLFTRRLEPGELVSLDLARELYRLAFDLRRRIGILATREGRILEVIVGTKEILYLPDLGRYRFGKGRLRQLRLIFSDLSNKSEEIAIPSDIYADLEKLRLDAVIAIKEIKNQVGLRFAHLVPGNAKDKNASFVHSQHIPDIGRLELDFTDYMEELEVQLDFEAQSRPAPHGNGAVLIGVYPKKFQDAASRMAELQELARTAGVKVIDTVVQYREPDPKTLLGKGKLEEVVLHCLRLGAELLIFDTELKPAQWRIITNATELKVIDRTMLILDIFAQRASSSDGRVQVELAQLKYTLPRLVEKDAGLSRLSGGIGGRGPGETKLEIGRRRIRDRIADLERRINKLKDERGLKRKRRKGQHIPLIGILGYTNVGKSTLFNALTGSSVLAENKLFATLDPAQRKLVLEPNEEEAQRGIWGVPVVLSDTVGFIRELPAELASAFRATLEELHEADVLMHVLDASDPEILERKRTVEKILEEMGLAAAPRINVLNKIDAVDEETMRSLSRETEGIPVSAKDRKNFQLLLARIRRVLGDLPIANAHSDEHSFHDAAES